ncbi:MULTISPECIES: acyl-ACP desaturase [Streptosporangium]|uniref:Acyl-[acyl-carrier-protein] desaturase n=1 Tax=Streptosporangium brasiliense TaxID=47480 RepID=A0ABT9QXS4_9ACTN|nr:acyl-ACP desaturase [Streptosporangium brasiliense]MDP9861412.1 acyl-[acyl-carrier-protein] desaturase [Streptosporangium brasiliense]
MSSTVDHERSATLFWELEPVVAENMERHLAVVRDWNPHDYVPWSQGRDFALLGGEDWRPEDTRIDPAARASLIVNLLTEDNLPAYHHNLMTALGSGGAWGEWVYRWTAEEARHAITLRDYLVVTRAVDPVDLEKRRMQFTSSGGAGEPVELLPNVVYTAFQELATRLSHRNTGSATGCPIGEQLLARIAADENLHMLFYRNLVGSALELAPDETMEAIRDVVRDFEMPGAGQPGFRRFATMIANAGIYDLRLHHDKVIMPILRHWQIFERADFTARGEAAREDLAAFLRKLDAQAGRFTERRAERSAAARR